MLRRRSGWDYKGLGLYVVTLTLADRSDAWLGRLMRKDAKAAGAVMLPSEGEWGVALTAAGEIVLREWRALTANWPGVEAEEIQIMPEHLHGIIRVTRPQTHPLGQIIGSFKAKTTASLRASGLHVPASLLAGESLWAKGFQDTILWSCARYENELHYLLVNPERLAVKRAHPELFRVVRDLEVDLPGLGSELSSTVKGRFCAIGNHFLLAKTLYQVQCSRRYFSYRRFDNPKRPGQKIIARDAQGEPVVEFSTPEFEARLSEACSRAACGEVLISPCVSDGERQIARAALNAGWALVTMSNKGFAKLQKPSGRHFDACAAGRLLMLAPAAWPYQPAEKPMTRNDATAMNRLCQWLAGSGAAACNYHGMRPQDVDAQARAAAELPSQ